VTLVREQTIRPSDSRLSAKLVPTFADRGYRLISATDPHGRILGFLDLELLLFLSSTYSVVLTRVSGPRYRPTTLEKTGSAGDLWICSQEL
jgi:hypothetical protein